MYFCCALCGQSSHICLVSRLPREAKTKLQHIFTFQHGHIVVFHGKEKAALLFTARAATGATWQCLFHKPVCLYLLNGPALSHEIRQLAHCALWSLYNYPILPPATSTPPAFVMVPLCGVLYFLMFYETFNAMQAEIWGKIQDQVLETPRSAAYC